MAFARYGHPQVEIPFDDPDSARRFALHHSRTTGEPVEVHGGTGQPTVFRRPAWRDGDFREFPAAAMCSVHGDPVTTTAHDTEADALAEATRQRGLRRVAVVWCVGEPTDAPDPAPAPTTHGRPSEAAHGQPRKPERDARGNYTSEIREDA